MKKKNWMFLLAVALATQACAKEGATVKYPTEATNFEMSDDWGGVDRDSKKSFFEECAREARGLQEWEITAICRCEYLKRKKLTDHCGDES